MLSTDNILHLTKSNKQGQFVIQVVLHLTLRLRPEWGPQDLGCLIQPDGTCALGDSLRPRFVSFWVPISRHLFKSRRCKRVELTLTHALPNSPRPFLSAQWPFMATTTSATLSQLLAGGWCDALDIQADSHRLIYSEDILIQCGSLILLQQFVSCPAIFILKN
jgi:hypothetical protein